MKSSYYAVRRRDADTTALIERADHPQQIAASSFRETMINTGDITRCPIRKPRIGAPELRS